MRIDNSVLAIDPAECGCTECMTGQYKRLDRATDDDVQAMFLGILRDNTNTTWTVHQRDDGRYDVHGDDYDFTIDRIIFPIPVDRYVLDIDVDLAIANIAHLRTPTA